MRTEVLEDGTVHYISEGHVVLTGTATGEVELPDGKVIDVTPPVVEVADAEQALTLAEIISKNQEG